MPEYEVELTEPAKTGLTSLARQDQREVYKQLLKLKRAPELGKPLGNQVGRSLAGYRALRACQKRVRIIYCIEGFKLVVTVIYIGSREDAKVYEVAAKVADQRKRLRAIPSPEIGVPIELEQPSARHRRAP